MITYHPASKADLEQVLALLEASGLPTAGVPEHISSFILAKDEGKLAGCAGLEVHDKAGLLRSVAVEQNHRSMGIGLELTRAILELAKQKHLNSLSLLTETAQNYFPRFGFMPVHRSELPKSLWESQEFKGACPDTAVAMMLKGR
jgi:amino-acid N-acetyltransferase